MAKWNESEHPRDDDGKFTDGTGGGRTQWITSKRDFSNVQASVAQRVFDDDETASFTEVKQVEDLIKNKKWFIAMKPSRSKVVICNLQGAYSKHIRHYTKGSHNLSVNWLV